MSVDYDDENDDDEDNAPPDVESKHFVTIIPVGYPGFDVSRRPFYSKEMDSPEFSKFRKYVVDKRGGDLHVMKPGFHGRRFRDEDDRHSGSDSDSEVAFHVQVSEGTVDS